MHKTFVVLTYPGHFFFTALTLQSFLKYHSRPDKILVIVDDLSPVAWSGYVDDCKKYYKNLADQVVATSNFGFLQKFMSSGWIRQQMIKLYIDQIIDDHVCFFSDGDVMFMNTIESEITPYTVPEPTHVTEMNDTYIQNMLGIENPGFKINNRRICVSNPPFRTLQANVISSLRTTIEQRLQTGFDTAHEIRQQDLAMSEWELIEHFKYHNLGMQLNFVQYAPHDFTHTKYTLDFFDHQFITCYCSDAGVGQQWFAEQGVEELDKYWHLVKDIHK